MAVGLDEPIGSFERLQQPNHVSDKYILAHETLYNL